LNLFAAWSSDSAITSKVYLIKIRSYNQAIPK
jgi:hypothetical protein